VDAVLVGTLAGGDAGPQHRREHRVERRQVAHDAIFDQVLEVGHLAGVDERGDHLPVGGIPADEQGLGHGAKLVWEDAGPLPAAERWPVMSDNGPACACSGRLSAGNGGPGQRLSAVL
jgi:hypothetical protein